MPSIKLINLIIYAGLLVISAFVIRAVSTLPASMPGDVGSAFLPTILAWAVIVLCIIGVVRTVLAGQEGVFQVEYLGRILITIGAVSLFVLSWSKLGYFYFQTFALLFGLFLYYRAPRGFGTRNVVLSAGVAAGITLSCYIIFRHLIYVDL